MSKEELPINHAINVVFLFIPQLCRVSVKKKCAPARKGLQCTKKSSSKTFHPDNSANFGLGKDKFKDEKAPN